MKPRDVAIIPDGMAWIVRSTWIEQRQVAVPLADTSGAAPKMLGRKSTVYQNVGTVREESFDTHAAAIKRRDVILEMIESGTAIQ